MGQKYASYNASGVVITYYDSIDSPPPSTATVLAITDAQWQAALACQYPPILVQNDTLVIPTGPTLWQAQTAQIALLRGAYGNANAANISFTDAAGVTDTYQCDPASVQAMKTYIAGGSVPKGFIWRSATNANNAFTYGDLTALVAAIAARNFANFQTLQSLIAKVRGSKKPASVSWPAS